MSIMNSYNAMADETAKLRQRLTLADAKLLQHEIEWDGEKYAFTPRSSYPEDFGHVCTPGCHNPCLLDD